MLSNFSSKELLSRFSCVRLCATLWTAAYQAPLSMGFSRQECWGGLPLCLLISWLQSPSAVILEPLRIKSDTVNHCFPIYFP